MKEEQRRLLADVRNALEYAIEQGIDGVGAPLDKVAPPVKAPTSDLSRLKDEEKQKRMAALEVRTKDCRLCGLAAGRTQVVFAAGDPTSPLVFVGEGPGEEEDKQGFPFVGRAGKLLTKMIESIGQTRESVFICNVVKCRPPSNRNPEPEEADACWPYLREQIEIVQPRLIVGLESVAVKRLLNRDIPIGRIRGTPSRLSIGGWTTLFLPTYHPAYLLRSPGKKSEAMRDFFKIRSLIESG